MSFFKHFFVFQRLNSLWLNLIPTCHNGNPPAITAVTQHTGPAGDFTCFTRK